MVTPLFIIKTIPAKVQILAKIRIAYNSLNAIIGYNWSHFWKYGVNSS